MSISFLITFFYQGFLNDWIINDGFKIFLFEIFTIPILFGLIQFIAIKNFPPTEILNRYFSMIVTFFLLLLLLSLVIFITIKEDVYWLFFYFLISFFTKYIVFEKAKSLKDLKREYALIFFVMISTIAITVIVGFLVLLIIGIESLFTDHRMLSVFGFLYFISLMITNWYAEDHIDLLARKILKNPD